MSIETWQGGNGNGVSPYQAQSQAAPKRTLARLIEWAQAAQAAHQVAESLVQTSFVPQQFRGKPHEATAAILAGDEVGLSPMASLNAFSIIQGAAAAKAMTLRAVVQSHGHEVWQVEATETRAIFKGRRKGSEEVHESEWTIERARNLGLVNRNPEWKKQAKAMLIARATSEVCRLTAADAILGIPYSAEELADGVTPEPQAPQSPDVPAQEKPAAAEPARRTTRRRTAPRSAAANQAGPVAQQPAQPAAEEPSGPPLPGEEGYDTDPVPASDAVTYEQLTKLHTVFSNGGVANKQTRLEAVRLMVGREDLTTSKELTKAEAHQLINQLEDLTKDTDVSLAEVLDEMLGRQNDEPAGEQS